MFDCGEGTQRQMMSMAFDHGRRQQANALAIGDGLRKEIACQFFPAHDVISCLKLKHLYRDFGLSIAQGTRVA